MTYTIAAIFSYSVAFPAIIGLVRFKKINSVYYPFLYCMWLALANEIISSFVITGGHSNAINDNIYGLCEALLFTWQFKNWGLFRRSKHLFTGIVIIFIIFWAVECFLINGIVYNISYFSIFYSFAIVLMSINVLNTQLLNEKKNVLKNSIFILCITFIIYYVNRVIVGMFWLYGLNSSRSFLIDITSILIYINLLSNLLYALAVLWMPTRHRYSLPF